MSAYIEYKSKKIKFRIVKKCKPYYDGKPYTIEVYHNLDFIFYKYDWWRTEIMDFNIINEKCLKYNNALVFSTLEDAEYVFNNIINSNVLDQHSINLILDLTDEDVQKLECEDEVIMESK